MWHHDRWLARETIACVFILFAIISYYRGPAQRLISTNLRDKAQKRDVIEREGGRAFVFEKRRVFRGLRVSTGECEFVFQWAPHEWAGYDPSVTPLAVRCYAAPADAVTHGKLWPKDQLLSGLGKTIVWSRSEVTAMLCGDDPLGAVGARGRQARRRRLQ